MCVFEALKAAAWWNDVNVDIDWIDAAKLGSDDYDIDLQAIRRHRGARWLRHPRRRRQNQSRPSRAYKPSSVPWLCYGLHMAVIAAARLAVLNRANTTEVDPDAKRPVIATMADQKGKENTGGTMRLGDYDCDLAKGQLASGQLYGSDTDRRAPPPPL